MFSFKSEHPWQSCKFAWLTSVLPNVFEYLFKSNERLPNCLIICCIEWSLILHSESHNFLISLLLSTCPIVGIPTRRSQNLNLAKSDKPLARRNTVSGEIKQTSGTICVSLGALHFSWCYCLTKNWSHSHVLWLTPIQRPISHWF